MTPLIQGVQVPQPPEVPTPPIPPEIIFRDQSFWAGLPPGIVLVITIAAVAAAVVVLWPIVRALARSIEARTESRLGIPVEVERLQARVAELEALPPRLAELEERLDFTERMLTRSPAGPPLRSGDT